MKGFVIGVALGGVVMLFVASQMLPLWDSSEVAKCRENIEWCAIQEPRLHKAMTGEPATQQQGE